MNKALSLFITLLLTVTVFAGCASADAPAPPSVPEPAPASAPEPEPPPPEPPTPELPQLEEPQAEEEIEAPATGLRITVSDENELRYAVSQLGAEQTTITLLSNIELVSNFVVPNGSDVILESLEGEMFSLIATRNMDTITVEPNANLTIENIGITRISGTSGRGVSSEGVVIMNDGVISNNHLGSPYNGGGIWSVTFTMNGGEISGNRTGDNGGGVYITRNFTMNGGLISGNFASFDGGGVSGCNHIFNPRPADFHFHMTGGIIRDNTSERNGGGVFLRSLTLVFDGGWVYGNSAANSDNLHLGDNDIFNNNVFDPNVGAIGNPLPS